MCKFVKVIPRIKCDYLLILVKDCTTALNSLASLFSLLLWHLFLFPYNSFYFVYRLIFLPTSVVQF